MHPFFAFPFAHGYRPRFDQPLRQYKGTYNLYTHWDQNLDPVLDTGLRLRPLTRFLRPCRGVNNQWLALINWIVSLNRGYNCQSLGQTVPFLYVLVDQSPLLGVPYRYMDYYRGLPY